MVNTNENILFGGIPSENLAIGYQSLGEYCYVKLQNHGTKLLLIHSITNETISADQLLTRSLQIANKLRQFGVKTGDIVAICSDNEPEFCYVTLAVIFLGAAIFPISTFYNERELEYFIQLVCPTIVLTSNECVDRVWKVSQSHASIKHVIAFRENLKCECLSDILNESEKLNYTTIVPQDMNDNVAVIFVSSGLGGLQKGAQLTQANIFASLREKYLDESDFYMSITPYVHLTGFITMLIWIVHGHRAAILPKFDTDLFLSCVERFKINSLFMPPPPMVLLAESPKVCEYNLTSLRTIIYGSGTIDTDLVQSIGKRIGVPHLRTFQTYGLTESIGILAQPFDRAIGSANSFGYLRAGVWGKVIDFNTHAVLGPNQVGHMVFKGPHNMKGYINDAEATSKAFDADGFLYTGDVGYHNEMGEWYFVERMKELIKYNNINISPREVEMQLMMHPNIKDAVVIGLPDAVVGELPLAFIVRNGILTENDVSEFIKKLVSSPKLLQGGVRFVEDIPRIGNFRKTLKMIAISSKTDTNFINN